MDDDLKLTVDEGPRGTPRVRTEPEPRGSGTLVSKEQRYESGAEIARGGMGRVLEATDTLLGRVVAVKEALATDPDALRRFQRETRITARLEHPSIVPVYDAGTLADYVMRKVSGSPLDELYRVRESELAIWRINLPASAELTVLLTSTMTDATIDPAGTLLRWP